MIYQKFHAWVLFLLSGEGDTHTHSLKFINHFTQEVNKTNMISLLKET